MARSAPIAKFALCTAIFLLAVACGGSEPAPEARPAADTASIDIIAGFVRQPSPGAFATAAYFDIRSARDDRLLSAQSDAAGAVEIHTMTMDEAGVARMDRLSDLPLPAGETVRLAPGGLHLMLIDPEPALQEDGATVTVTLVFEEAGETTVTLPVGAPGAE